MASLGNITVTVTVDADELSKGLIRFLSWAESTGFHNEEVENLRNLLRIATESETCQKETEVGELRELGLKFLHKSLVILKSKIRSAEMGRRLRDLLTR